MFYKEVTQSIFCNARSHEPYRINYCVIILMLRNVYYCPIDNDHLTVLLMKLFQCPHEGAKFAYLGAAKIIDDIMQQISENDQRFCSYLSIHHKFLDGLPIYVHFMLTTK
jgi:hypothetical protein